MNLIDAELVRLQLAAQTPAEVLGKLADTLFGKGKVKESYKDAVLQREIQYPTGLPGAGTCVAVPHTDSSHVLEPALAVGILQQPVAFQMMGSLDTVLPVEIVMMLAVDKPEKHLAVLTQLMTMLQDETLLTRIKQATVATEVCSLLSGLSAGHM